LRSRPRSEYEIRRRLKLKGYEDPVIDGLIEDLRRIGDVDDAKFARLWVESRMRSNPAGDIILRQELKTKGVSDGIIDDVLGDKAKNYDEYAIAFDMALERFNRLKKLDRPKAMKRLYDFLLRRAFAYETVKKIVDELVKRQ
jgi:regulatory protein